MKLLEIIGSEELTAAEKIEAISTIVDEARSRYGNTEEEISVPEVSTCEGLQNLKLLDNASKVALASQEIRHITLVATEFNRAVEGSLLDRKIEELLATSSLLSNLKATAESKYI